MEEALNNSFNILYGVRANGYRVEIGRNLQVGRELTVNDQIRSFVALELDFPRGLAMNSVGYEFTVGTDMVRAEVQKWGGKE